MDRMDRIGRIGILGVLVGCLFLASPSWAFPTLEVQCPPSSPVSFIPSGVCQSPVTLGAGQSVHLIVDLPAPCFPGVTNYRVSNGPNLEDQATPGTAITRSGISAIRFPDGSATNAKVSFRVDNASDGAATMFVGFKWVCEAL